MKTNSDPTTETNWFTHPTMSERIHPLWFWNGEMLDEEISWQIREMAKQGMGGFFICPRQGLTIPYLSDAWFQKVKHAVKEAEKQGLEVWLYDEYPYPSGIAGGEVLLEHPDAKHQLLHHQVIAASGGELCVEELPWGRLLSAKAVPLDPETGGRDWEHAVDVSNCVGNSQAEPLVQKTGLTDYNRKRFFTFHTVKKLHWVAPQGRWEVHVYLEKELKDFKYFGSFIDPCHKGAVETFIRLTHERYAREIGEYFGRTVKGVFADETGFLGENPWSPKLVSYFNTQYGYDIRDHLHALLYGEAENAAKVRHDYYQALHVMLRENFHLPIRKWCDQHGLHYVAEVPAMRMSTQRHSTIIGGDSAHEKLGRPLKWILDFYTKKFRNNPKMVSSLSRQLGCNRALIECFHSVGWSMTLQDARWMIDRMAAMGINYFNFHASFYTLDGLTKHDAPPSQFIQAPYWKHFRTLGDYTGRISAVMSHGVADNTIAVLDPTTTFWTHMGNPLRRGFIHCGKNAEGAAKLERFKEQWVEICQSLLFQRIDYDHLDPEILAEATVKDGKIIIGFAAYSILVIPPISNVEHAAWKVIKQFIEHGGTVIAQGALPYEEIEGQTGVCAEIRSYFGQKSGRENVVFLQDGRELIPTLEKRQPQAVTLRVEGGSEAFLMQRRIMEDRSFVVFASNQEEDEHRAALVIDTQRLREKLAAKSGASLRATKLNLENGEREPLKVEKEKGVDLLPLVFAPYESHLVEFAFVEQPKAVANTPRWELPVKARELWEVTPDRANVVRLDRFDLVAGNLSGEDIDVMTFIEQCAQMGRSPGVNFDHQSFGLPVIVRNRYPLQCTYTTSFVVEHLPVTCGLLMDRGAISGDFVMTVNGERILREDFRPHEFYDHLNCACDISRFLRVGDNTLSVQVEVARDWDGVVDALYLIGDFGVELRGSDVKKKAALITPGKRAALCSGPVQGYPYYAGTLTYTRNVEVTELPNASTFELVFPDWDSHLHECVEVCVNDASLGVRPWTPYRWTGATGLLVKGQNRVAVKVTNTLVGMLEGQYFDYAAHQLKGVQ